MISPSRVDKKSGDVLGFRLPEKNAHESHTGSLDESACDTCKESAESEFVHHLRYSRAQSTLHINMTSDLSFSLKHCKACC